MATYSGDAPIFTMPNGANSDGLLGGGGLGALLIGALLFGGGMGGFGGRNGWGSSPGNNAVATDIVLNPVFQGIQQQVTALGSQINQNAIADTMTDINGGLATAIAGVNDNLNGTTRDILAGQATVLASQQANNFTTLSSINGLGRDVTAQANQNALQQLNSFNQLNTAIFQGIGALTLQQVTATNQIIAQGTALSTQLASCCCDIREKIGADGDATRALINDLNVQNLRDALAAANNKVSNNDQNQYLLNTILSHLSPNRRDREI